MSTPIRPMAWWEIALAILITFALFIGGSYAISTTFAAESYLTSVIRYSLNIVLFAGGAWLLGVRRGRLSWAELGLAPPRLSGLWISFAIGLTFVMFPVRVAIGWLVLIAQHGSIAQAQAELQPRMDILTAGGTDAINIATALVGVGLIVPIAEELFFRGLIYTTLRRLIPIAPAVLLSSTVFAIGHADSLSVVATSFVLGAANALLYEGSRSLVPPMVVHMLTNTLALIIVFATMALGAPAS